MSQSSQQVKSEWAKHIQQYDESKLTRKAYCEQNSLNYDQFGYWKKKLKDQAHNKPKQQHNTVPSQFIPVSVKSSPINTGLSISLPNGVVFKGVEEQNQTLTLAIIKALS